LGDPQKAQAHRALTESDLKSLETLISIAEKSPKAAIKDSWEILSKNAIETAKLLGFRRDEEGDSDLSQAVNYLSAEINSQEFMVGVYALRIALQNVEKTPIADVSAKDAQEFVKACMTILSRLILTIGSSL